MYVYLLGLWEHPEIPPLFIPDILKRRNDKCRHPARKHIPHFTRTRTHNGPPQSLSKPRSAEVEVYIEHHHVLCPRKQPRDVSPCVELSFKCVQYKMYVNVCRHARRRCI